ncbi:hypothetical protein UFOVP1462_21 [uncultured Caudovirales phage]|uniref:Uncharacterized protein n=1 Tax=uncultured Caudovirales phage TaxID=2100421 RepID=A0A6J5S2I3_9CAUD|nr:hypothetical protein UFOVP1013_21 [uncultured Caudovirales phage]CAB4202820.1 hypothetical protein UFOVP1364_38 [uncultured Caudovirales phage]CAB4214194.1 hypothetical protein UFOVP1462_21 [uncultured Caudovirales phage]CAB5228728.1 hypothetical protein UFOVP1550_30 [uncultured Caudovirales phage]
MGAVKNEYMEIVDEMYNVAEALVFAAEENEFDLMVMTLVECTAKLAVLTRRYHVLHERA